MSVLITNEEFSILDHQNYISKMFNKVHTSSEHKSFNIKSSIFSISDDNSCALKTHASRKRKKLDVIHEASFVRAKLEKVLLKMPPEIFNHLRCNYNLLSTTSVRNIAKDLFETTAFSHNGILGGNDSNFPLKCKVNNDYFLLPRKSRFFCGDVIEQCKKLDGKKFDIVIADPPWWNKYIRRLKAANSKLSYSMMYNEEIALIPVKNLLADNCLVAVWCTNSPSNVTAVKDLIFPNWGVEYVTTWYWLKVTTGFKPVCEFGSGSKKQPYERIIFGKVGEVGHIPKEHLIISVPSALHSHKPPLLDVLQPYVIAEDPQALELFARYLLPNTTSVGYEPLKWQHISLYESLEETLC
ncbi:unnamed protein product [Parnassius mnemosyne]|uniref:Methyltransferase-like protein 4 n=1 Tax=Parnassius mnemosyne TaxID=213953 RepID=A0AAV1KMP3_9NEOP